jgi:solute carrier family 38 (sodium-coupled neutral amino acid transporter), member 11
MSKPNYLLNSFDVESKSSSHVAESRKSEGKLPNILLQVSFSIDEPNVTSDILPKGEGGNSMLMTGFLMLNAMIGSGILNQPEVFSQAGIGSAIIMFMVAAGFIWLSLIVLIECGIKCGKFDYSELAKSLFGDTGEAIVDVAIALGNFGALLSYLDIIGGTSSDLFLSWGCESSTGCGPYVTTTIISLLFILPMCSMRYFGHLAFYSVFSMTAIISCLFLVVIAGPIVGSGGRTEGFKKGSGVQLGSVIFTLNCAFAAFHSYKSMKDPTSAKWRIISASIVLIGVAMCCIMGVAGYVSFGDDVDGVILNNFTGHYADFFKILLVVHLIL